MVVYTNIGTGNLLSQTLDQLLYVAAHQQLL